VLELLYQFMAITTKSGSLRANSLKLHRAISILDLETTGTFVEIDRIVEIGILKVLPDGTKRRFSQRVNPESKIPKEAIAIHGITDADVADAPTFKKIAREVEKFLRNSDLAGFNLKSFDVRILQAEFDRAGVPFSCADRHVIDAKEIYHHHESRTLSDAVRFYCEAEHQDAHSSLADAEATWRVLRAQVSRYGLPPKVSDLAGWLEKIRPSKYADSGGWFVMRDSKRIFARGKYKGQRLRDIATEHPDYLEWITGLPDAPDDTKELIRRALRHAGR
jgi:DNA polymerase III subunit epsilon